MARYLREPSTSDAKVNGPALLDVHAFGVMFPALHEFLTLDQWESGRKRVPGSLTMFVELGVLKFCVSDKDRKALAFVSGAGLEDTLERVEEGLAEGTLVWRPAKERGGR